MPKKQSQLDISYTVTVYRYPQDAEYKGLQFIREVPAKVKEHEQHVDIVSIRGEELYNWAKENARFGHNWLQCGSYTSCNK